MHSMSFLAKVLSSYKNPTLFECGHFHVNRDGTIYNKCLAKHKRVLNNRELWGTGVFTCSGKMHILQTWLNTRLTWRDIIIPQCAASWNMSPNHTGIFHKVDQEKHNYRVCWRSYWSRDDLVPSFQVYSIEHERQRMKLFSSWCIFLAHLTKVNIVTASQMMIKDPDQSSQSRDG